MGSDETYASYIVRLPISEAQADIIGMPREVFEPAVKVIGRRVSSAELRRMHDHTRKSDE